MNPVTETKTLRQQLKANGVPVSDLSNHATDLQVLYTEERLELIKSLVDYPQNIEIHLSNIEGQAWHGKHFIEIPFAYTE